MRTTNFKFWLRGMPTRPGPDGWISAYTIAEGLEVPVSHAKQVMRRFKALGLVEAGELDYCRRRLYRITGAGLKVLHGARLVEPEIKVRAQ